MSRKRRVFEVDLPETGPEPEPDLPIAEGRRGPMATAIGENAGALRIRDAVEADIRAENDALAHEFVRLKRQGLVVDRVPVSAIDTDKLVRDRSRSADLDLEGLKRSIREVGLSNPIRVEPDGRGRYQLIQGFRRLAAWTALRLETGDPLYDQIPAGMMASGESLDMLYRRMVDENLVRKDISFAEMARLAMAYAAERVEGCEDIDMAVRRLYASTSAQKRSYIRRFARLLATLDHVLEHAEQIPRALGLSLVEHIEASPMAEAALVRRLIAAGPGRSAEDELDILRDFVARPIERHPASSRMSQRRGRVSLSVPVGPGVRCTATDGKLELRADLDFGAVDRETLEAAIEMFFIEIGRH